jgi:endonuclease YncB( thermonuclease family)
MMIYFNRVLKSVPLLLVLQLSGYAEPISNKNYGSALVSEVTSIYDGDTFRADLKGYPEIIGDRIGIRINGIDTPEMRGECQKEKRLARQAKQFVVTQLRSAKRVELRNMKRGKYFRIVADVYVDGKNLGDMLISNTMAVSYDGGTKAKDWCR